MFIETNFINVMTSHIIVYKQINVQTQRGFVPVDSRMRVIDASGELVGMTNVLFTHSRQFSFNSLGFVITRFLTCIALVMQMEK